jgi:hypothetical protein
VTGVDGVPEAAVEAAARDMYEANAEFHRALAAARDRTVDLPERPVWDEAPSYHRELYAVRARAALAAALPLLTADKVEEHAECTWVCGACGRSPEAHALNRPAADCVYQPTLRHNHSVAKVEDARAARLASALERTEANFISAVNGRPVRDMAETLAENRAALAGPASDDTADVS